MFADLFDDAGRRSVPPMIVAVVMVLQRLKGCSDREAADRFAFDARWKYAAGGLDFDYPGFGHTVLVDMRACPGRDSQISPKNAASIIMPSTVRVVVCTPGSYRLSNSRSRSASMGPIGGAPSGVVSFLAFALNDRS